MQQLLISHFVRSESDCRGYYEDRLRRFLGQFYEVKSREFKVSMYQDFAGCN